MGQDPHAARGAKGARDCGQHKRRLESSSTVEVDRQAGQDRCDYAATRPEENSLVALHQMALTRLRSLASPLSDAIVLRSLSPVQ